MPCETVNNRRHVVIRDDIVTKTGVPAWMRVEAQKAARAHELGLSTGLFRSPEILDHDAAAGRISLEFMPNIVSLADALASGGPDPSVFDGIGRALAAIHENLMLPDNLRIPLPSEYDLPGTEVFLHGDFGYSNIFLHRDDGSIVILDWQVSHRLAIPATYGSRFFDVAWFVNRLFYKPVRGSCFSPDLIADRFLRGYRQGCRDGNISEQFNEYMPKFFAAQMARCNWLRWRRFLRRLNCHRKIRRFAGRSPALRYA